MLVSISHRLPSQTQPHSWPSGGKIHPKMSTPNPANSEIVIGIQTIGLRNKPTGEIRPYCLQTIGSEIVQITAPVRNTRQVSPPAPFIHRTYQGRERAIKRSRGS